MKIAGPSTLELMTSINPIVWTVFGGIGTIYGPVTGVYILFPLVEFLRVVQEIRTLLFALLVIAILLLMPEGIGVWIRDKAECKCPRCKLVNFTTRHICRACGAQLHLAKEANTNPSLQMHRLIHGSSWQPVGSGTSLITSEASDAKMMS